MRNHRKLLIIDGRIAFLGGINISSVYSGRSFHQSSKIRPGAILPWRDTDLKVQGRPLDAPHAFDFFFQLTGHPFDSAQKRTGIASIMKSVERG